MLKTVSGAPTWQYDRRPGLFEIERFAGDHEAGADKQAPARSMRNPASRPIAGAVYGWALYFDRVGGAVEDPPYVNVCLHCGAGHHALSLYRQYPWAYLCPVCDRVNPFVRPFRYGA